MDGVTCLCGDNVYVKVWFRRQIGLNTCDRPIWTNRCASSRGIFGVSLQVIVGLSNGIAAEVLHREVSSKPARVRAVPMLSWMLRQTENRTGVSTVQLPIAPILLHDRPYRDDDSRAYQRPIVLAVL